jgi:CBS domain-containing membrane protein
MAVKSVLHEVRSYLGIERNTTSHLEKVVSTFGAILGIIAVYWCARWAFPNGFMSTAGHFLMITSIGASAVLLFAVPHGALSQPWSVFGGHIISAFIGVTCHVFFPYEIWTGALAVGLAVGAMHYFRCIHPPGGATALAAVIGGSEIYSLGYYFLIMPVLTNVTAILLMATLFNAFFPWRRYPAHLSRRQKPSLQIKPAERQFELTHEDFAAAMEQLGSYIDVTAEDLTELLELAKQHAEKNITHPSKILRGRSYSNGKLGSLWAVRQVIDAEENTHGDSHKIIFKTVAGAGAYQNGLCRRDEFRQWARFEVTQQNGRWVKVEDQA